MSVGRRFIDGGEEGGGEKSITRRNAFAIAIALAGSI